jgi:hypothetical protein
LPRASCAAIHFSAWSAAVAVEEDQCGGCDIVFRSAGEAVLEFSDVHERRSAGGLAATYRGDAAPHSPSAERLSELPAGQRSGYRGWVAGTACAESEVT